jgi:hypothetical protein
MLIQEADLNSLYGCILDAGIRLMSADMASMQVLRPTRQGFGTHAMERMIRSQLNGEMRFDWHAEGLACEIILRT